MPRGLSPLGRAVRRALADLSDCGAGAALIGGLAVSSRAEPRFTRDADLAVAVAGDPEAERILFELRRRGYVPSAAFEHTDRGRLATVRLVPPGSSREGVLIDLLFASSGIEPEVVRDAELLQVFPGVRAPVARTGHLVALKLLSRDPARRPQDEMDLRALVAALDEQEIARARSAVSAIEARGYHRDRDLVSALERLLDDRA